MDWPRTCTVFRKANQVGSKTPNQTFSCLSRPDQNREPRGVHGPPQPVVAEQRHPENRKFGPAVGATMPVLAPEPARFHRQPGPPAEAPQHQHQQQLHYSDRQPE